MGKGQHRPDLEDYKKKNKKIHCLKNQPVKRNLKIYYAKLITGKL